MQRAVQVCAGVLLLFLFITHGRTLMSLLLPIILALFLTLLLVPLADYLEKKVRSRLLATLMVAIPSFSLLFWVIWWLGLQVYREAERFVRNIPSLLRLLEGLIEERLIPIIEDTAYKEMIYEFFEEFLLGAIESLQGLAMTVVETGFSFLGSLPGLFVSVMVVLVLTFFLIYDKTWILQVLPGVEDNIQKVVNSIHGFIKVQFFLISTTAAICMVAFTLLGIPYVVVFGATIALLDLLPIVGAGTLLIPMAIWYILIGSSGQGIAIAILYIVIIVVRQVVEPRLLSTNLGIHPIVAIVCLFLGLQLFGLLGLILLPLTASVASTFPQYSWLRR